MTDRDKWGLTIERRDALVNAVRAVKVLDRVGVPTGELVKDPNIEHELFFMMADLRKANVEWDAVNKRSQELVKMRSQLQTQIRALGSTLNSMSLLTEKEDG